jgi:hypothetical protein
MLIEAKAELPHGEFATMVQRKLNFDPSTARRLMIIAEHPAISNRAHGHALPSSWRTLYELTKLPADELKTALAEGTVNPKTQRKDVAAMMQAKRTPETHQQKSTAVLPKNLEVIEPLTLRVASRHFTKVLAVPTRSLPELTDPTEQDMPTREEAEESYQQTLRDLGEPYDRQSPWAAHGQPAPNDDLEDDFLPKKIEQSNEMNVFMMNCYASVQVAHYSGPVDDKVIKACRKAAQAWTALLTKLEEHT